MILIIQVYQIINNFYFLIYLSALIYDQFGERDNLAANHGWQYEGISYYVSKTATSKPTYRLYAPSLGGVHLLTGDVNERNTLLQNGFWIDEGIAWYQP